ncbi:MAG: PGF-pre-PGF domain-containing protein [Methanoregula sp.]|jgi:PKD repeat protein
MGNQRYLLVFAGLLIVVLGIIGATVTADGTADLACGNSMAVLEERHPLMHFTDKQMNEMQEQRDAAPVYTAPPRALSREGAVALASSKDLLPYLTYTPSERDQGYCGNCWVWAATGALEIRSTVKSGISDRISIQYFNSRYENGAGSGWACCGGWTSTYTSWYAVNNITVPWSNTNASYGDYRSGCERIATAVPADSISTNPALKVSNISYAKVQTYGAGRSAAISNIKSALDADRPVVYSFYYGNDGWNDFSDFWNIQDESAVFDPTPHAGEDDAGGHSVLIVGYNDTEPNHPYWIVLNSWGTMPGRAHGLFRLNMTMDYDTDIYEGTETYQQHYFDVLDADVARVPAPRVDFTTNVTHGIVPLAVQFTDRSEIVFPARWNWSFGDGAWYNTTDAAATGPLHLYSGIGTYPVSLTVSGTSGTHSLNRAGYIRVFPVPTPPIPAATLGPDTDDDSSTSPGQTSASITAATLGETVPPVTITVNIGGDSKAWQAIVTGTKLSGLIVTGTVQSGPGTNQTAPPGTVYQYISLVPARFTDISKAVIHFTVPQAWLDENHIDPKSIVLYHQTANGWVALPTTMLSTKDVTVYFSGESAGFSLFAIAGMPGVTIPDATATTTREIMSDVVHTPIPTAVAKAPVTTQTTAPPAAPSPLMNIVLVIAAIGILTGGGFMVRRWWIRRQNPALFAEYD